MGAYVEELLKTVNIEIRQEDEKYAERYASVLKTAVTAAFALICVSVFLFMLKSGIKFTGLFLTLLVVVFVYLHIKRTKEHTEQILYENCDPLKYLSRYAALLKVSRRFGSTFDEHYYNIGSAFDYAGLDDEAFKLLDLFRNRCTDEKGAFMYELLAARIAFTDNNAEALKEHLSMATKLRKEFNTTQHQEKLYDNAMQLPIMLDIAEKKEYRKGLDAFAHTSKTKFNNKLDELISNYFLYILGKGLNDDWLVEKHGNFVIENGGTMWHKEQVLAERSN